MGSFEKTALALTVIAFSVALFSISDFTQTNTSLSDGDNLDCGFTQDFSDFLKSNGNEFILLQAILHSSSKDLTSNVELLVVKALQLKNSKRHQLSSFMETAMLPSEEELQMVMLPGKLDSDLWPLILLPKVGTSQNFTPLPGDQLIQIKLKTIIIPKKL